MHSNDSKEEEGFFERIEKSPDSGLDLENGTREREITLLQARR